MSRKRRKRTVERAPYATGTPSGGVVIPASQLHQIMAQQQYQQMTQVKNKGSQGQSLFSPGVPLETQPGTSPKGLPLREVA